MNPRKLQCQAPYCSEPVGEFEKYCSDECEERDDTW